MFSAKDNDDSFVRKHTHHTTGGGGGGAGGERSELLDSHGRKQTHQTTDRRRICLTCQTCRSCCHKATVTYQNAGNCGTLYQHHTIGWGGGWGAGQYCTIYRPTPRIPVQRSQPCLPFGALPRYSSALGFGDLGWLPKIRGTFKGGCRVSVLRIRVSENERYLSGVPYKGL